MNMIAGDQRAAFTLSTAPLSPDVSAEAILKEHALQVRRGSNGTIENPTVHREERKECCGHPSFLITYSGRAQGLSVSYLQFLVAVPGRAYIHTWTTGTDSFAALEPLFEKTSRAFIVQGEDPRQPSRSDARSGARGTPAPSPSTAIRPSFSTEELAAPLSSCNYDRHGLNFTLAIPSGWDTRPLIAMPPDAEILNFSHPSKGARGLVHVHALPRGFHPGQTDWDGWLERCRTGRGVHVERREPGTCSGYASLLTVFRSGSAAASRSTLSYFIAAPTVLYEIGWQCEPHDFAVLAPLFEKCSRQFVLASPAASPAAPAPATSKKPPLNRSLYPSVFEDKERGLTIPVPQGWTAEPRAQLSAIAVIAVMTERGSGSTLRIRVEPTPLGLKEATPNWDGYLKALQDGEKSMEFNEARVDRQRSSICCGHPAYEVSWSYRAGTRAMSRYSYYVATPDTLYRLDWNAGPSHMERMQPLLEGCAREFTIPRKR